MDRPRLPESVVTPLTSPEDKLIGTPNTLNRLHAPIHSFTTRLHALAAELFRPLRPNTLRNPNLNESHLPTPRTPTFPRRRGLEVSGGALAAVGMALTGVRPARADEGESGEVTAEPPAPDGQSGVAGMQVGPDGVPIVMSPLREVSFLEAPKTVYGNLAQDGYAVWSMGNTKLHVTDQAVAQDIFRRRMLTQDKGVQVVVFDDIKQIPAEFKPKVRISRAVVIGDEALEISSYAFADGIGVVDGVTVRIFAPVDPLDKQLAVLGSDRKTMTVREAFESDVSGQISFTIQRLYWDNWDQMTDEEKAPIRKDMNAVRVGLFKIG